MKFTPNSNKRQPIEFNGNIVGHIVDGVFEASRRGSKHKYLEMPDWLISMHILEHLDDVGIQDVRFIDLESKLKYEATLTDFQKFGVPINYSGDPHLWLPLACWRISDYLKTSR